MSRMCIVVIDGINMDIVMKTGRMPAPGESLRIGLAIKKIENIKKEAADGLPDDKTHEKKSDVAAQPLCDDESNQTRVCLVGAVGGDEFGTVLLDKLASNGVDVSQVQVFADEESATAIVIIETNSGESRSIAFHGATKKWKFNPGENSSIRCLAGGFKPELVICHLSIALHEAMRVLEAAARESIPTLLKPSPATHLDADIYQHATHLVMNETEMMTLCSQLDAESDHGLAAWTEASDFFLHLGVKTVIITLGAKGAYYATSNREKGLIEAEKNVRVVDSTGAGDTFVGTYAVKYVQQIRRGSLDIKTIIQRACRAAARTIEHVGAQESIPWADEIDALS